MDFKVTVKDEYVTALGRYFGNESNPQEAIQAVLDKVITDGYDFVIADSDPDVLQKKQEVEDLIRQKKESKLK